MHLLLQTAHHRVARQHYLPGFGQLCIALEQPVQLIERVLLQHCAHSRARRRCQLRTWLTAQLRGKFQRTLLRVLPQPACCRSQLRSQCRPLRQRSAQRSRQRRRLQSLQRQHLRRLPQRLQQLRHLWIVCQRQQRHAGLRRKQRRVIAHCQHGIAAGQRSRSLRRAARPACAQHPLRKRHLPRQARSQRIIIQRAARQLLHCNKLQRAAGLALHAGQRSHYRRLPCPGAAPLAQRHAQHRPHCANGSSRHGRQQPSTISSHVHARHRHIEHAQGFQRLCVAHACKCSQLHYRLREQARRGRAQRANAHTPQRQRLAQQLRQHGKPAVICQPGVIGRKHACRVKAAGIMQQPAATQHGPVAVAQRGRNCIQIGKVNRGDSMRRLRGSRITAEHGALRSGLRRAQLDQQRLQNRFIAGIGEAVVPANHKLHADTADSAGCSALRVAVGGAAPPRV